MGKLTWLVGPSGFGKDSLLAELCQQEPAQLPVMHRYIIRAANAGDEDHVMLSEQESFTRAKQNLLVLSQHANGFYYGVGVEIDLWLHAGSDMVVSGSRARLPQAQARYGTSLLSVCLQASPVILCQRLWAHGWESEAEIVAHLKRATRYTPYSCYVPNSNGSLLQSVDILLTLMGRREEKHVYL